MFKIGDFVYEVAFLAEEYSNFFDRDVQLEFPYVFEVDKATIKNFVNSFKGSTTHFMFFYNNVLGLRIVYMDDNKTKNAYITLSDNTEYDSFFSMNISTLNLERALKVIGDKTVKLAFVGQDMPIKIMDEYIELVVAPYIVGEV